MDSLHSAIKTPSKNGLAAREQPSPTSQDLQPVRKHAQSFAQRHANASLSL